MHAHNQITEVSAASREKRVGFPLINVVKMPALILHLDRFVIVFGRMKMKKLTTTKFHNCFGKKSTTFAAWLAVCRYVYGRYTYVRVS